MQGGRIASSMAAFWLLASTVLVTDATAAEPVRLVNLMPSFWRFWHQAQPIPIPEQRVTLNRLYLQPNAAVWRDLQAPCGKDLQEAELDQEYLPLLPQLVGPMRSLQRTLPMTIARARTLFRGPP